MTMTEPQRAPVEWRSATVTDVRYGERMIDLLVVPYNEDTVIEYRGKLVTESVLPGAFDGLEAVPERIVVNLDHDRTRPIGIARSIDTRAADGLVASVFISPTPAGNDALTLAADQVLAPSIGMGVLPRDQRWSEGGQRRQITRAFLDHIALTSQQQYLGARVLAVRGVDDGLVELPEPPSTPMLDEALAFAASIDQMLRARDA